MNFTQIGDALLNQESEHWEKDVTVMDEKTCKTCGSQLIHRKDSSRKKGWRLYCKTCSLARDRRRYADNESIRANALSKSAAQHLATIHSEDPKIRDESRAKMTSRSARSQAKLRANSKWRNDRNKYVRGWMKEKRKDPIFRLISGIRSRTSRAIKAQNAPRNERSLNLLGTSVAKARAHIESNFRPGMSWDNYGKWEIDHIRPCASFDLGDPEQQKACFHYTNLQPLWRSENRSKRDSWGEGVTS